MHKESKYSTSRNLQLPSRRRNMELEEQVSMEIQISNPNRWKELLENLQLLHREMLLRNLLRRIMEIKGMDQDREVLVQDHHNNSNKLRKKLKKTSKKYKNSNCRDRRVNLRERKQKRSYKKKRKMIERKRKKSRTRK